MPTIETPSKPKVSWSRRTAASPNRVVLEVVTGENLCSFKNRKRVTKRGGLITDPDVKRRQDRLEAHILLSFYFASPTGEHETDLDSLRALRTLLSGLCDDSLKQIPEFSFAVEYVKPEDAGVQITIERHKS